MTTTLKNLAAEVAAILGDSPEADSLPEECPFPCIENRVRILAPGILSKLILDKARSEGILDVPDSLYSSFLSAIAGEIESHGPGR